MFKVLVEAGKRDLKHASVTSWVARVQAASASWNSSLTLAQSSAQSPSKMDQVSCATCCSISSTLATTASIACTQKGLSASLQELQPALPGSPRSRGQEVRPAFASIKVCRTVLRSDLPRLAGKGNAYTCLCRTCIKHCR